MGSCAGTAAAPRVLPGSTISIPYLANQDNDARLAAAQAVRGLGFEPMPHLAARRIASFAKLESFIQRAVAEAGVKRCFVIAGDPSTPLGPFADSSSLIESGVFERSGKRPMGAIPLAQDTRGQHHRTQAQVPHRNGSPASSASTVRAIDWQIGGANTINALLELPSVGRW